MMAMTSKDSIESFPRRKRNRLPEYDYAKGGMYYITVCAKQQKKLFGSIVGANCVRPQLSPLGKLIKEEIQKLDHIYNGVHVDRYVIMPNHVHMLIAIDGRTQFAPTISRIVKQWKGAITKKAGDSPWQKSYYDHVARDEKDYLRIAEYMENNPAKWELDAYYDMVRGDG
ncbi:MAG: transposase [Clostridiales Family XIII bacterium]|jgi:REP element-mobilizing transposase RayT|nr:transposase [Clostridiales Family XIII bacterium]